MPELVKVGTAHGMVCSFADLVGVKVRHNLLVRRNLVLKRFMDVALVIPAAIAALPIIGLAALAIRLVDAGSPFYAQERIGRGGVRFKVWKLRTMYLDASERLERHLEEDLHARDEWQRRYKLTRDPRILPGIGRWLRKSSLDELPQLFNIARGEMSFVGPRPFPDYHVEAFDPSFRELRTKVMPGLTGLWQVTSRSESDLARQKMLDSYYIANWSPWLDLY
ncbi:MAG: sugar transferase, partial [Trueperaceae bacterium]|nr:sugar transferase [Trueperaceae bacterium]